MYIAPNSIVKIMRNVPLDNSYNHTVKFATKTAQELYFSSVNIVKYTFQQVSYQRAEKETMRLEVRTEDLYDCNYLAFRNTSFGDKWFYAFITGWEYINNETTEITYEIDVMQTYLFDIDVKQCYVEREHVVDDTIGANTIAEPIDCPEAEVISRRPVHFNRWKVVINYTPSMINLIANSVYNFCHEITVNIDGKIAQTTDTIAKGYLTLFKQMNSIIESTAHSLFPNNAGDWREHQFTGMIPYVSPVISEDALIGNVQAVIADIQRNIDLMNATGGTVNSVYQIPAEIDENFIYGAEFDVEAEWFAPIDRFFYIDNRDPVYYIPKNKKLFTSPYTYMHVINKQGGEMKLAYEKIQDKHFRFQGAWQNGDVSVVMYNDNYGTKGTDNYASQMMCRLPIGNFPVCNYNVNGFFSKLAHSIGGLTRAILSQATYRPTTTTTDVSGTKETTTAQHRQGRRILSSFKTTKETSPTHAESTTDKPQLQNYVADLGNISNNFIGLIQHINGSTTTSSVDIANDQMGYEIHTMEITAEYAEIIDNFFEHFGYAVKKNKVPNMSSRPHWNYVKTGDTYITGNCPADALNKIISIFQNGITFWKVPSEVGNYSLNNH